jgi:hypothetical protein
MFDGQETNQPTIPHEGQREPVPPPVVPRQRNRGLRTGAIIALSLVLLLVLGIGLFAGWEFGRDTTSNSGLLQSGNTPAATVPPLAGNNIDAVREAVIAKVKADALVSKSPGDTVAVQFYRGNQQMTVNMRLGELQAG